MTRQEYILKCMQLDDYWFSVFKRWADKLVFSGENNCWVWGAYCDNNGYGKLSSFKGKSPYKAHRLSLAFVDKERKGLGSLHKCDNPSCVNPNHLYWGTQKQNMRDASKRNRLNKRSLLNLRPGEKGFLGAGSKSNGEIKSER